MTIATLAQSLVLTQAEHGYDCSSALLPGISPQALEGQISWLPLPAAAELCELYQWRGGQNLGAERTLWLRDMQFLAPSEAREEYEMMLAAYGPYNSRKSEGVDLSQCYPFAAFNGGWYVLPLGGQDIRPDLPMPVLSVFQGVEVYFHSLEALLRTCLEWAKVGRTPDHEISQELELQIWREVNPGIF